MKQKQLTVKDLTEYIDNVILMKEYFLSSQESENAKHDLNKSFEQLNKYIKKIRSINIKTKIDPLPGGHDSYLRIKDFLNWANGQANKLLNNRYK